MYNKSRQRIELEASEFLLSRATPFDLRPRNRGARTSTHAVCYLSGCCPGTEIRAK